MNTLVATMLMALAMTATSAAGKQPSPRPSFVVILVDDMGMGDLSLTGHPTIRTPHLDQMAREGLRFTSLYAAPACTPTRHVHDEPLSGSHGAALANRPR